MSLWTTFKCTACQIQHVQLGICLIRHHVVAKGLSHSNILLNLPALFVEQHGMSQAVIHSGEGWKPNIYILFCIIVIFLHMQAKLSSAKNKVCQ